MKRLITLAALLAFLFGTTLSAFADDDKGKGKGKGKQALGDPAAAFKKMDANSDGKVTKEEFAKLRENLPGKLKDKTNGKGLEAINDRIFSMADENKDGSLSLDEFKKMREKMTDRLKKAKGKSGK